MGNVPYSAEYRGKELSQDFPDTYQRSSASPEMFGSQIGEAIQQTGAELFNLHDIFYQVRADDSANAFQEQMNKTLYGDPDKVTIDAAGTPIPTPGFLAMQGRNALNVSQAVNEEIDRSFKKIRDELGDAQAQMNFDQKARSLKENYSEIVQRHTLTEGKAYAQSVNQTSVDLALRSINIDPFSDKVFKAALTQIESAYVKNANLDGESLIGLDAAAKKAGEVALTHRIQGIQASGVKGSVRKAFDLVKANPEVLGEQYNVLFDNLKKQASDEENGIKANDLNSAINSGKIPPVDTKQAIGARAYLSAVSIHADRPGDTGNLAPQFAIKLASAIQDAHSIGLQVGLGSGYRSPTETTNQGRNDSAARYDRAGFSLHDKGAAADISGLDGPNGTKTRQWAQIAAKHGLFNPYGIGNVNEYNHWQGVNYKLEDKPEILATIKKAGGNQELIWQAIEGTPSGFYKVPAYPAYDNNRLALALGAQSSGEQPALASPLGPADSPTGPMVDSDAGKTISEREDHQHAIVQALADKYGNDPARIAVAYFSGEANVAPMASILPYIADMKGENGQLTSAYVADTLKRYGVPSPDVPTIVATSSGGSLGLAVPDDGTGQPGVLVADNGSSRSMVAPYVAGSVPTNSVPATQQKIPPSVALATAFQVIDNDPTLSEEDKDSIKRHFVKKIKQNDLVESMRREEDEKRNNDTVEEYVTRIRNNDRVSTLIEDAKHDGRLDRNGLNVVLGTVERLGMPGGLNVQYGSSFTDGVLALNTPIGSPGAIDEAYVNKQMSLGNLSLRGRDYLIEQIKKRDNELFGPAKAAALSGMTSFLSDIILGSDKQNTSPRRKALMDQLLPQLLAAAALRIEKGENFIDVYTDQKWVMKFIHSKVNLYDLNRKDYEDTASNEEIAAFSSNDSLRPEEITPEFWEYLIKTPLAYNNASMSLPKMTLPQWLTSVRLLIKDPSKNAINQFNKFIERHGLLYTAEEILSTYSHFKKYNVTVAPKISAPDSPVEQKYRFDYPGFFGIPVPDK